MVASTVVNHTLVTLEFEDVEDIELDGFGPQNVLFDLELEEVELASGRQLRVTLPASNGMDASFRCRTLSVLDARPFEPGEHSVYVAEWLRRPPWPTRRALRRQVTDCYLRWSEEVSTTSKFEPVTRPSVCSWSFDQRGSGAPETYQSEPLSATITP